MSFLSNVWNWAKGNSIVSSLAKTAALGFMLNQVTKQMYKNNDAGKEPDRGNRVTVKANTNNNIPVIYGEAYVGGVITDAQMTNNNRTMWFCVTLSETTGNLLSSNFATESQFDVDEVYWNSMRVGFKADGNTVNNLTDEDGNVNSNVNGLIKMYFFRKGSQTPWNFSSETTTSSQYAYNLMPNWTATDLMTNLAFVLVRVDYSSKNDVRSLGELKFKVRNSMTKPGDVMYDYMNNSRYGAGIPDSEIYIQ